MASASAIRPALTSAVSFSITASKAVIASSSESASLRASAGVDTDGSGLLVCAALCRAMMACLPGSARAGGLLHDEAAIDVRGQADAAGLGEGFRIFVGQHRAPDAGARGAAERSVALHVGGHLREHRVEEH